MLAIPIVVMRVLNIVMDLLLMITMIMNMKIDIVNVGVKVADEAKAKKENNP